MKLLIALVFITGFLTPVFGTGKIYTIEIESCYDGDTCRGNILECNLPEACENVPFRIAEIDTPEIRGKCAREKRLAITARDFVRQKLIGQRIQTTLKRGKFFRWIIHIPSVIDGLLERGLAYNYDGKKKSWCND